VGASICLLGVAGDQLGYRRKQAKRGWPKPAAARRGPEERPWGSAATGAGLAPAHHRAGCTPGALAVAGSSASFAPKLADTCGSESAKPLVTHHRVDHQALRRFRLAPRGNQPGGNPGQALVGKWCHGPAASGALGRLFLRGRWAGDLGLPWRSLIESLIGATSAGAHRC